ncbi:MAG: hypothetical protein ABEH59_04210 [Halobacteriales archaeon]
MVLNADFSAPEWLALVGAIVAGIAAFLPWVTAGIQAGPLELSASSTGIEGLGVLTLVLAVAGIGLALTMSVEERGAVLTGIVGVVIGAVAVWKITDISGAASPGVGLYLTVIGGLGLLVAGVWGHQFADREALL